MSVLSASMLLLFSGSASVMIIKRRVVTLDADDLLRRFHPFQLSGHTRFIDEDVASSEDAYRETGGFSGAWSRWRNRVVFLRICQLREDIPESDLHKIRLRMAELTRASIALMMLVPLRFLARRKVDGAALTAFRLYADIAGETYACLSLGDEPLYAEKLSALL